VTEKNRESKNYLNMHKRFETAILDYSMIEEGDHVLAGLSGGKDSTVMLKLLARKKVELKAKYTLSAAFLRQGFPNDDDIEAYLRNFCDDLGVALYIRSSNVPEILDESSKVKPCYACSRNRRLKLLKLAGEIGANVISFGHHRDDMIETLLMNMIYSNNLGTIGPNTPFFKGEFRIIRPMMYIHEHQIKKEVSDSGINAFSTGCPHEGNTERDYVKGLIKEICSHRKGAKISIFRSMFSYDPDYLLKPPSKESMAR
jgi:tRNA 2-thiocytidine biosynthesis protein TtcA